jgi:hypothetical protein
LSASQLAQTHLESLTMSPPEFLGSIRRRNEPPRFFKQAVGDLKLFILQPLPNLAAAIHNRRTTKRFKTLNQRGVVNHIHLAKKFPKFGG